MPERSEAPGNAAPLSIDRRGAVAHVRLDRPATRNAFDERLAAALREAFETLSADASVRAIVLGGAGEAFCAGGDVAWMRRTGALSKDANLDDAKAFAAAFAAIDRCPRPVIGRIHGVAVGGGAGLAAVCDVAVAAASTVFGFPEVRLGIVPAAISPYVIRKIGWSQARRLFLTGERFDAATALRIGLVHEVAPAEDGALDAAVEAAVGKVLAGGPEAHVRVKRLLKGLNALAPDGALLDLTARTIADARGGAEGQEGLSAFLEKRKPRWAP